jgi:hypothetical protein
MTDDIVFWLREFDERNGYPKCSEAADGIERLRAKQEDLANLLADAYGSIMDWDEVLKERANYEAVCQIERLRAALNADAQTLRLHLGDMTAQEMRAVQAAFAWVLAEKHVADATLGGQTWGRER